MARCVVGEDEAVAAQPYAETRQAEVEDVVEALALVVAPQSVNLV
jgi:hypothetical protein